MEGSQQSELDQLKRLVLSEEQGKLDQLQEKLTQVSDPRFYGENLPRAMTASHEKAAQDLAEALRSPLVDAMKLSVTKDRKSISSVLFPIMGPAIRLYVSDLFKSLIDQLNETIKSTTSIRRLLWRIEAKAAGKPYSEYILLKTLNYRIEKLFLIAPDSGLLLQLVSREEKIDDNPELVSGMLIAIRSFVRDSFADENDAGELGRFSFGEHEIYLETGPNAILAAVGKGTPPPAYRQQMAEVLETIHVESAERLESFNGDTDSLLDVRPKLETLLIENNGADSKNANPWPVRIAFGLIVAALLGIWVTSFLNNRKWDKAEEALKSEPGIEVVHSASAGWNRRMIEVLKDPLARDPQVILEENTISAELTSLRISPFLSLDEPFASKRKQVEEASAAKVVKLTEALEELKKSIRDLKSNVISGAQIQSLKVSDFYSRFEVKETVSLRHDKASNIWFISGTSIQPSYSRIKEESGGIFEGAKVNFTGLKDVTAVRMKALRKEIESIKISYLGITDKVSKSGLQAREKLHKALIELDELYALSGYPDLPIIEIYAVPLLGGSNRLGSIGVRDRIVTETTAIKRKGISPARISPFVDKMERPQRDAWVHFKIRPAVNF